MREDSADALRVQREPSDRHVTMLRGLHHVADRLNLVEGQALHLRSWTAGPVVQRAGIVGIDPRVVTRRRQPEHSQRRRQRHRLAGALDRGKQTSLVSGIGNASSFELIARDAKQCEHQAQDGREHRDAPFELRNANMMGRLPT